ncbi:uncharacterized protein LOC129985233 isoform X2 [Argiope bruennichi]|uniref:uncharacterized protein LOC129985233 isoform X2 n=1 Tax=Argiope bruennichi TaxID=94029 RepID=UPI002494ACA2|nr:uncharacterized protein LOC129985233 isoform X2 [Argiope bruennichi]
MTSAAFWFGLVIAAILIATPVSCLKCISCRCGSSSKNYTLCIENDQKEENPCNTWAQCLTCTHNTAHCITCPPKRSGPLCTKVADALRKKEFTNDSCPRLGNPKAIFTRCTQHGNYRFFYFNFRGRKRRQDRRM